MEGLSDSELARRVHVGIGAEVELFGSSSPSGRLIRRGGVVASLNPANPDRSIFNCVTALDPAEIEPMLDELEDTYSEVGVRAWTVWITPGHPLGVDVLAERGHVVDAEPRSMGIELGEFSPPDVELPDGVELRPARDLTEVCEINDAAYGLEGAWAAALEGQPRPGSSWLVADDGSGGVVCAATIDVGDDACVTAVAARPEHRGGGITAAILGRLLVEARERGMRTASLQASKLGAPVYARLGFRDVGNTESGRSGSRRPSRTPADWRRRDPPACGWNHPRHGVRRPLRRTCHRRTGKRSTSG